MALPALGHQTVLEPVRGHHTHQEMVDRDYTVHYRSGFRGHCPDPAAGLLRGDVAGCILADRICLCHARHSGGRILHAGSGLLRPIAVRRNTQRVLPTGDHHRTGRSRDGGRMDGDGFRQCPEGLGGNLSHPVGIVLRGSRVPLADIAPARRRQTLGKHTAECRQGRTRRLHTHYKC